jgi:hypothetical protein
MLTLIEVTDMKTIFHDNHHSSLLKYMEQRYNFVFRGEETTREHYEFIFKNVLPIVSYPTQEEKYLPSVVSWLECRS